jgi:hypothetical protein
MVARELVWVEIERFHGWACSACAWEFKSLGPLVGNTLEEMKETMSDGATKSSTRMCTPKHPKRPAE